MDDVLPQIDYVDFAKVDIRAGVITDAQLFPEARRPAYKIWVDLGLLGIKKSSAQITENYTCADLLGRQVACVVNFPPRRIGPFMSEILILGFPDSSGRVVLIAPDIAVPIGGRLY